MRKVRFKATEIVRALKERRGRNKSIHGWQNLLKFRNELEE